ncbi:MAG: hypothetical protein HY897_20150 [Deltaproteobacteria bacterium]|nr:hypothetical protein [Deltaproteobacteria bacterium]
MKPFLRVFSVATTLSLTAGCGCDNDGHAVDAGAGGALDASVDGTEDSASPGEDSGPGPDACCDLGDGGPDDGSDAGENGDAAADGGDADAGDPYFDLDPSPFGFHPAFAGGIPGDPWAPAQKAGVAWTRDGSEPYVFWALVDPDRTGDPAKMRFAGEVTGPDGKPARFDYDAGIAGAVASGLSVMWNIAVEPVIFGYSKAGSWLPVDEAAYAGFVKTTVKRYPAIRVWQVGNEPDIQLGFPPEPKLADFAKLQKLTYGAIKEADPGVVVVMGGAADWPGPGRGFFDQVLDDLGGCCVDAFDFHLYGDPNGGTLMAEGGLPSLGYPHIETWAKEIRQHLDARGFLKTPLWTTENGTFSGTVSFGPAKMTATEAEQARDLPKRTVVALASGVEKLFWAFGISEGLGSLDDYDTDYFDHTGLIYTGKTFPAGTKKLGYWALWQMTRQLQGCDWRRFSRIETAVPEARAYRCTRTDGGEVAVVWWDTFYVSDFEKGDTVDVTVPWPAQTAVVRSAVPSFASGAEVTDPGTAFATSTLIVSGGYVTLSLGADPMYVREE